MAKKVAYYLTEFKAFLWIAGYLFKDYKKVIRAAERILWEDEYR